MNLKETLIKLLETVSPFLGFGGRMAVVAIIQLIKRFVPDSEQVKAVLNSVAAAPAAAKQFIVELFEQLKDFAPAWSHGIVDWVVDEVINKWLLDMAWDRLFPPPAGVTPRVMQADLTRAAACELKLAPIVEGLDISQVIAA